MLLGAELTRVAGLVDAAIWRKALIWGLLVGLPTFAFGARKKVMVKVCSDSELAFRMKRNIT